MASTAFLLRSLLVAAQDVGHVKLNLAADCDVAVTWSVPVGLERLNEAPKELKKSLKRA